MDDQKRNVETGAGLQESRLNQDFIDLLKKYGTTVLLVLLAIMATYVGIQRYSQFQQDKTDQAFADLDNAANTPAVLLAVAEQWDGRASVWEIATIRAAKAYLDSARTRTEAGVNPAEVAETDLLSDERVVASLNEAATLYERVLNRTAGSKPIFAQQARWGLATAHMSLAALADDEQRTAHFDNAETALRDFVSAAEGTDPNKVAIGTKRLELIDMLRSDPVTIYETANLPESARFQPDPVEAAFSPNTTTPEGPQGRVLQGTEMTPEQIQQFMREQGFNAENPETIDPATIDFGAGAGATPPPSDDTSGADGDGTTEDPAGNDGAGSDDPASDDPGSEDPPAGNPGQ
jgi:hypothetical protein